MSHNSFGHLFRFTTWGESHGPAIGCVVDGCPPKIELSAADIQVFMDKRRPGTSRFVTQRNEPDQVKILSGVFEGQTTGTPISLLIENTDQRSKDYSEIKSRYRPGHADLTYDAIKVAVDRDMIFYVAGFSILHSALMVLGFHISKLIITGKILPKLKQMSSDIIHWGELFSGLGWGLILYLVIM